MSGVGFLYSGGLWFLFIVEVSPSGWGCTVKFRLLCLEWPFCILVICGSFLLWRFLPVGGVGRLACQGFLVREVASVFWCVEVDFFSLECNGVSDSAF